MSLQTISAACVGVHVEVRVAHVGVHVDVRVVNAHDGVHVDVRVAHAHDTMCSIGRSTEALLSSACELQEQATLYLGRRARHP